MAFSEPAESYTIARKSLDRMDKDQFGHVFYRHLFSLGPHLEARFAETDFTKQASLLRHAVWALLQHSAGFRVGELAVERIGIAHSRSGLDIAPEEYAHWLKSLILTVQELDPKQNGDTVAAWERCAQPGLEIIKGKY